MSRTKTVLTGSFVMLLARGVGMLSSLLTVSLLTRTLTKDAFGLWSVIGSFVVFSGTFDLGLGQGLKNKLAALSVNSSVESLKNQKDYFFSTFYLLFLVAGIGVILTAFLSPSINWGYLFNIHDNYLNNNINSLMTIVISLLFFNLPLAINNSGFLAYQEAHWRGLLDILQSLSLLLSVFITLHYLHFQTIVITYYLTFNLLALISTFVFIQCRHWSFTWIPIKEQFDKVKPIIKTSLQFWFLGISATIVLSTDPIIASRVVGLAEAGDFSIVQRMFALLIAIHFTILMPLWSAYTLAAEKNEWDWIRKNLIRSVYFTLGLFLIGGSLIIIMHKLIFKIWIGREINNFPLVITMAIWALLLGWSSCFSVFINGFNRIKLQMLLSIFSAIINIPISLYLGHIYGVVGVSIGSIISILPSVISNPTQAFNILRFKKNAA